MRLAEEHYGPIRPRGEPPARMRPREPKPVAKRTVTVTDDKVEQPAWQRVYLCPSHATGAPGEAEALEVLAHLLGGGPTSYLYRTLVIDGRKAVAAGAYYAGSALDDTRFFLYGMPAPGVSPRRTRRGVRRGRRRLHRRGRARGRSWSAARPG